MLKSRITTGIILFGILIIFVLAGFIAVSPLLANAAEGEILFSETAFTYMPSADLTSQVYTNATIGSTIRIKMTQTQYQCISDVKYTLVKITAVDDVVTYDESDIYVNSKAIDATSVVSSGNITAFTLYATPSQASYAYFEIVAKEWCAIILDVTYDLGGGEDISYSSAVYSVTNIDNSLPSAYYKSWSYESGSYTFLVTVSGNQTKYTRSANSGIKKIVFTKIVSGEEIILETIENLTEIRYSYELVADTNLKAYYYAKVTDYVGNTNVCLIVTLGSYNKDFESAVNNTIEEIERASELFSPYILSDLTDAFATYYLYVQAFYEAGSDTTAQANAEAKIDAQRIVITDLIYDYTQIRTLAENGQKDYSLTIINEEYLSGIELVEVENSYEALLYGETATFTIALAEYDTSKVDKTAEMLASGINNISKVLGLTLATSNSIKGEVNITFTSPLQIKVPVSDYGAVSCVVKITDSEGNVTYENLEITEYTTYILINMPYSQGVITLMTSENNGNRLLWLLLLLIVPVGAGVFLVVIKIKKDKQKKLQQEIVENSEESEKTAYNPKNKSKKGNKKKK